MNKIKFLLLSSAIALFSSSTIASELPESKNVVSNLKVKLSGYEHFQTAYRSQNHLTGDEKKLSTNMKDFALYNDAALVADISNEINDFTYGGKIVLSTTAKRKGGSSYNGTHIYVKTDYGLVQLGSPVGAGTIMSVDAGDVSAATGGGDWDNYANLGTDYLKNGTSLEPSFSSYTEFFLDSKLVTSLEKRAYSSEPNRKISYYTPKFEFGTGSKLQVGVSYIPDSANTGADTISTNSNKPAKKVISSTQYFKIDQSVKNAVAGGVVLEQNISDGVDLKIGLTGQVAKSSGRAQLFDSTDTDEKNPLETYKLKDLRTYNIGSVLNIGNFGYAVSFGSLGKSLTTPAYHKTGQDTKYYTAGVGYKQGPFSASVSYFRSDTYKNILNCLTIGTDYKLAPGFKPYAEISQFDVKGKPEYFPEKSKRSTRGTVALIGAKLSL